MTTYHTLVDVANAVNARLTAVLAGLPVPIAAPKFHYGKDALTLQEDAPRIVWVPKAGGADGKIQKAADFGPDFLVTPSPTDYPGPAPLWRRTPTLEAHVWGIRDNAATDHDATKDYRAAELLANHLVGAVHDLLFGSYEMAGENWDAPQASAGAATRRGAVVVVQFRVAMAWTKELEQTAVVTAMPVVVGSAHA